MIKKFFKSDVRFFLGALMTLIVLPFNFSVEDTSSIILNSVWLFFVIPLYYFYKHTFSNNDQKYLKVNALLSVFFSIIIKIGRDLILYSALSYSLSDILKDLFVVIGTSILIFSVLTSLLKLLSIDLTQNSLNKQYSFKFFFILFFIIWLPILFIFWPGIFSYDVPMQISELVSKNLSTHHPIIHTLLLNIIVVIGDRFGNYNAGALLYTLIQMIICVGINAYVCSEISKYKLNRVIYYSLIMYYLFFPLNMLFPFVATKDVLFSVFFFLFIFKLCDYYVLEPKELELKKAIELIILIILVGLFRNNAIYALLATIPALLFMKKKKIRNNLVFIFLVGIAITLISNQVLTTITHAKPGMEGQMYSVPLQQLACSYVRNPDSFTEKEKDEIFAYVPEKNLKNYNPRISDYVKSYFTLKNEGNSVINFLKLWGKIGVKNKKNYIDAFLMLTQGYWDPNLQFPDKYYKQPIIELRSYNTILSTKFHDDSKIPKIRNKIIDSFYLNNWYKKIPIISFLFSPGLVVWILLILFIYTLYKKIKDFNFIFIFLIMYYGTLILGPVTLVRYIYPYMLVWPMLAIFILYKSNKKSINSLTK
ncbi:DUF6020 family protein [Enterococcus devriesei]|uniref:DUF6020 family protein n=1 Tax=Enterococcus devriesei TaxID=319970 RepID=UPI0028A7C270|nr:DUF6020 family protein [Enterococcus devriesei]